MKTLGTDVGQRSHNAIPHQRTVLLEARRGNWLRTPQQQQKGSRRAFLIRAASCCGFRASLAASALMRMMSRTCHCEKVLHYQRRAEPHN